MPTNATILRIKEPEAFSKITTSPSSGINGLVLAGGHSRRMGQPKSLLNYHGKLQYRYVAELLSGFCEQVFISCRAEQQGLFEGYATILDSRIYGEIGPMNGLLSAFDQHKSNAWLIVGCDYPLLKKKDLEQLVRARNPNNVATIFYNPETQFIEPLLGIYEAYAGPLLHEWLNLGNQSIRRFLETQEINKVVPQHPERLKSVDTPEEYQRMLGRS